MSGPRTESNGRIVKADEPKPNSVLRYLSSPETKLEIMRALPEHLAPDRMLRVALTALRTTAHLAECDTPSFAGCLLQAAQLGLEVNTQLGHCYLIPRRNGDTYTCTMMLGYQGMIELALRSGKVTSIKTIVVRAGDTFEYEDGLKPVLRFKQSGAAERETKAITHVVGIAYIKNGDPIFEVLSRAQIDARMQRSDSFKGGRNSPWKTDYEAMARKTAVRALFKWIPKSPEIAAADHLEDSQERGSRAAFTSEVLEAMERQGLQSAPIDTVAELAADYDPETGEVQQQPAAPAS